MKKFILLFVLLASAVPAFSQTTYYISSSLGSNSNNGTSKLTPWKSHPWMPTGASCSGSGAAPSYTHVAGDQFIFYGGDTWGNACMYLNPQAGGSSPSVLDYYGTDSTWYNSSVCGGSFCRPKMDFQGAVATGGAMGGPTNRPQFFCPKCGVGGVSYIKLEHIEIVHYYWDQTLSTGSNQSPVIAGDANECNYIVNDIYMHDWTHGTLGAGTPDIMVVFTTRGNGCGPGGSNCSACSADQFTNSTIDNADGSCDSGQLGNGYQVSGNLAYCLPNGVVGDNYIFSNNVVSDQPNSFDDATVGGCIRCVHENGYEGWLDSNAYGCEYLFNNTINNTASHGITIFLDPEFGVNGGACVYFYNNSVFSSPNANPVYIDTDCGGGVFCDPTTSDHYLWNNTEAANGSNGACNRIVLRSVPTIRTLSLINNHCVTNFGSGNAGLYSFDSGITASTLVNTPNVVMSTATATSDGYTTGNAYRPTSSGSPTVGQGSNLTMNCSSFLTSLCSDATGVWNAGGTNFGSGMNMTRPSSGAWDAGAYEQGGGASTPVVSLSTSSLTYGNQIVNTTSAAQTVTLTNTGSATLTGTIALTTGTQFAISGGTCSTGSLSVAASGSCTVLVTFTPTSTGSKSDTLVFTTNAASSPNDVSLSGTGTAAPSSIGQIGGSAVIRGSGSIQ